MTSHRIHIAGASARSGTTLLAECMRLGFDIDAYEAHETTLARKRWGARIYLTKHPSSLALVRPRFAVDPRLYVLCMMRDPRDVIVSRHGKDQARYWTSLKAWKAQFAHIQALKDHPRFLLVRYEDLAAVPDECQHRIQQRLPFLRRTGAFSSFGAQTAVSHASAQALNGARAIDVASVGAWREHLPRLAGQFQLHGGVAAELIALGYEADDRWLRQLKGVAPDLTPSRSDLWSRAPARKVWDAAWARIDAGLSYASAKLDIPWV